MILYFYEDELDKTLQQWHLSYSFYTIQRKQVGDSALKGDALRLTTWIESLLHREQQNSQFDMYVSFGSRFVIVLLQQREFWIIFSKIKKETLKTS